MRFLTLMCTGLLLLTPIHLFSSVPNSYPPQKRWNGLVLVVASSPYSGTVHLLFLIISSICHSYYVKLVVPWKINQNKQQRTTQ